MLMVSLLWSGFSRMTELPIGLLLAECSGANLLEANWSSYQFICLMTWHPCPMLTDKTYSSHCSPLLSSISHLLQVTEMKKAGWKWSWNSENAQEQCVNCVGRSGSVVKTCALIPTLSLLPGLFSRKVSSLTSFQLCNTNTQPAPALRCAFDWWSFILCSILSICRIRCDQ